MLLESVYPDKIKTSSFINNQEKNKSENIHYLLELRNLNEFHYKPNLIVGYYGLKVAVFILDKTIPYYDENIKKYFNQNLALPKL